jgi:thymidylate synthase
MSEKISQNIFNNQKNPEEYQYLNLIQKIIDDGSWENGRNGKTKSIFGGSMRFSLTDGKIPILTTKQTAWKCCLKELLWFIKGQTDGKILKEQSVSIWSANGTRQFLDSRNLTDYNVDELGPIYGWQWRQFNKPYISNNRQNELNIKFEQSINEGSLYLNMELIDETNKLDEKGIDQLQQIIDSLKDPEQRTSRRLIMSAWNPCQLDQMALPPCHILCQFNVHDGNKLSCAMYQRSCDMFLGVPFNIASYSLLTHLIAKHCGLEAYEFIHFMGNCHLYENSINAANIQINREPYNFPTLSIKQIRDNINDYEVDDFEIHNYKHHERISVKMVA